MNIGTVKIGKTSLLCFPARKFVHQGSESKAGELHGVDCRGRVTSHCAGDDRQGACHF